MQKVDENRLKGNYGAAVVMSRLSGDCLVRPVAVDTDVGVDLYCETVTKEQNLPFLHFWLQVKAGNQCRLNKTDTVARCSFSKDHLEYWSQQPVPVFAALVPTDWPVQEEPTVYVIDITSQILFGTVAISKNSATLSADYTWRAGDKEAVRTFLESVVPETTARLQISKGLVTFTPTFQPEYVRTGPIVPVLKFRDSILSQLRTTAALSVIQMFLSEKGTRDDPEFRRLLVSIVQQFGDDRHWENFMSRALSSHIDEHFDHAVALYQEARKCINDDPNVRDQPIWQELASHVQSLEIKAQRKEKIGRAG